MTTLLIVLTVVEILILVAALAIYLVAITRSLITTTRALGKISFGVRAIETQTSVIGPGVIAINRHLTTLTGAFDELAQAAEALPAGDGHAHGHGQDSIVDKAIDKVRRGRRG